ncbi:MAG: hypothetical protein A2381_04690 [Bdellovibrionales bacterium RIFOXYB1_FULL_37_110]|nr:MAG: hypothetical protein A2181_01120 [Bdellovibrionales bacterium RIFOXYA1_FULL_38_20]OFZ50483.1 MAG: hypothetical protein A2417_10670 [Bdellovibrionales bacterium RIFOXYC1_FULL_37_79]OFZ60754.1 MAG: hypothetical protein A2381_04690 [Bdellovibrionales bacterium RIFOXYB1_FULL_37_110]OFZ64468.1 MAG: hypothetical protein A2577_08655 [Bdellovibrionales bacterium RIFOXYD1_FULL_36_51]OFZ67733.1 MAG: hypothetical protein A2328_07840 [Bdellovibrionales bacterium RIFOXYB2_FULL_36_6]
MTPFKRGRVRSKFKTKINIKSKEFELKDCITSDVSLNGLYVISEEKPLINTLCTINLILDNGIQKPISIELKGKVARMGKDGFALTFTEMDSDAFMHLKNIIQYNTDSPEDFFQECKKRIGYK